MEDQYADQIHQLRQECVAPEFLSKLFGIDWPPGSPFHEDFQAWEKQRSFQTRCQNGLLSRWAAEMFMEDHRVQPARWAAARLGMTAESFKQLLPQLPKAGLRRNYVLYPGLIDKSLAEDLVRGLKGVRFRTFGTNNAFCTILHGAIRDATGFEPEPWYCDTSLRLQEYERQFAAVIDSITLEGLSLKHAVWLRMEKPLRLAPDRCSKLFYAEHREEMRTLIAGIGEPEGLSAYLQWLEEHKGAIHG